MTTPPTAPWPSIVTPRLPLRSFPPPPIPAGYDTEIASTAIDTARALWPPLPIRSTHAQAAGRTLAATSARHNALVGNHTRGS